MTHARIGTSGFGIGRDKYVQLFSCVEVQHTFYQPPAITTLERWRANTPPEFEFVLKAWQLITHDAKSPTYRRLKTRLSEDEKLEAGYFRPSAIVKEALHVTLASANALKAKTILFQCPASFKPTGENINNLKKFFAGLNHSDCQGGAFNLCWEPRGDWAPKVVQSLCKELNLWHVVDPFLSKSITPDKIYYRLHGRNGWRYEYDEAELRELAQMISGARIEARGSAIVASSIPSSPAHEPYVFFNNIRMIQDALRFQAIIQEVEY